MIAELLWRPTRGEAIAGVEVFAFSNSSSQTAAAVEVIFTNDSRQAVEVHTVYGEFASGAGQNITARLFSLMRPDGTVVYHFRGDYTALAAGASGALDWSGNILLLPKWRLRSRGQWNAGANANSSVLHALGWWLPRGNLLG